MLCRQSQLCHVLESVITSNQYIILDKQGQIRLLMSVSLISGLGFHVWPGMYINLLY